MSNLENLIEYKKLIEYKNIIDKKYKSQPKKFKEIKSYLNVLEKKINVLNMLKNQYKLNTSDMLLKKNIKSHSDYINVKLNMIYNDFCKDNSSDEELSVESSLDSDENSNDHNTSNDKTDINDKKENAMDNPIAVYIEEL